MGIMTCSRTCATGLPVEKGEVVESALEVSVLKKKKRDFWCQYVSKPLKRLSFHPKSPKTQVRITSPFTSFFIDNLGYR